MLPTEKIRKGASELVRERKREREGKKACGSVISNRGTVEQVCEKPERRLKEPMAGQLRNVVSQ